MTSIRFDRSSVQEIRAVTTGDTRYSIDKYYYQPNYNYDKIIAIEKAGQMEFVIWYQLWKYGSVEREIPAHAVESVEYVQEIEEDECPF